MAALEHLLELEKIKTRKLMSNKGKGKLCPKCFAGSIEGAGNGKGMTMDIKEDMKGFSDKIGEKLKKNTLSESAHRKK